MLNNRKSLAKFMEPISTLGVKNMFKNILVMLFIIIGSNHAWAESKTTFYHYDLLGSPVATTDEQGNVIWREEYSPWGKKLLNQDVTKDNVRGYTGHVHDKETGLTYMQARYYDPDIGRFMGIDPVGFKESNPVFFNRYVYAGNNPYKFTDPNGEDLNSDIDDYDDYLDDKQAEKDAENANDDYLDDIINHRRAPPDWDTFKRDLAVNFTANAVFGLAGMGSISISKSAPKVALSVPNITKAYKRPSGATNQKMRESVQGKPCVKCGELTDKQVAGHKKALVEEYYETGKIDKAHMRSLDAIQPECPTCSAKEGAAMSRYSRQKKEELGL